MTGPQTSLVSDLTAKMRFTPVTLLALAAAATPAMGGPLAYAACQTGEYLPVRILNQH